MTDDLATLADPPSLPCLLVRGNYTDVISLKTVLIDMLTFTHSIYTFIDLKFVCCC